MPPPTAADPPGAARLTLIGTRHRSAGLEPLLDLLFALRPDHLTLEMSPYALRFRQIRGPFLIARLESLLDRLAAETGRPRAELAAHPEIVGIEALLTFPFEYRAAAAYSEQTGIPLELLDSSLVSARKLRRVESELVTRANLQVLLQIPSLADRQESAEAARFFLSECDAAIREAFLAGRRGPEGIGDRDRRLALALRRRLAPDRHLVHVGGWVHLVDDPRGETLYSRLRDLDLERRFLS